MTLTVKIVGHTPTGDDCRTDGCPNDPTCTVAFEGDALTATADMCESHAEGSIVTFDGRA